MIKRLNWQKFIKFWSQFYNPRHYPDEKYYFPYIKQNELDKMAILKLFEWKNGMPLSKNKNTITNSVIQSLSKVNKFKKLKRLSRESVEEFFNFGSQIVKSGIVWRVFLLHITRPVELPMIDRLTFIAVNFLETGKIIEFAKEYQNLEKYLEFKEIFNRIVQRSKLNYREVDKALMAFGQFLTNPQKFLK